VRRRGEKKMMGNFDLKRSFERWRKESLLSVSRSGAGLSHWKRQERDCTVFKNCSELYQDKLEKKGKRQSCLKPHMK